MSFSTNDPAPWPLVPDWTQPVRESLEWLTDILQASRTPVSQHRALRSVPRRRLAWRALAGAQDRRLADLMLADRGARTWWAPIWPDVQGVDVDLADDASTLPCMTAGFDFAAGGRALLWRSPRQWQLVDLTAVAADHLVLGGAVGAAWPAGTMLFPVRLARIDGAPEEQHLSDDVGARDNMAAQIVEPCAWPAAMPSAAVYRDWPVLEWRPEWSQAPGSAAARTLGVVDNDMATPAVLDMLERALRTQRGTWLLHGRAEHAAWRSLLYALAGRSRPVWVPSWTSDLQVVAPIGAGGTQLTVEWCGYTVFGRQQAGARDLRIELQDGTAICRRITGSAEGSTSGAGTELLTLNAAPGVAIAPEDIRQVCWLRLCTLASDTVDIEHVTDAAGVARCTLAFQEVGE